MSPRDLPVVTELGARRQARLVDARLAVVADTRATEGDLDALLRACCGASTDLLLLRDKTATEEQLRAAAPVFRQVADDHGALFVLNDLPGLAADVGADGTQVGQTDVHPDHARRVGGPDLLVGRTVQAPEQLDATADEDVDFVVVGPVGETGLDLVRYAARHAPTPWFVAGCPGHGGAVEAIDAGARRVMAAGDVTGADDPSAAVWALRRALGAAHE